MSIIPESQFSGKITPSSSSYPYGQARNITVPGDGTGTPWDAALANDLFGFQQALLSDAGVTPSGSPDTAEVSQYLEAVYRKSGCVFDSMASFLLSTLPTGLGSVLLSAYTGGWAATVAGPRGARRMHRTGATNAAPTVGNPVAVSTDGAGAQAGYAWDADGNEWYTSTGQYDLYTFGGVGDGVADDTQPFEDQVQVCGYAHVPAGTWRLAADINRKCLITGEGSTVSVIRPFVVGTAALTYTFTAQSNPALSYWNYHTVVKNVGFEGFGVKTGIGWTFGKTGPSNYAANDEFANNVTFLNCRFYQCEKGVQCPFGNIGLQFYNCGFQSNKYGLYALDSKFGGTMHAGNKYFFGGEISSNDCGVYVHNVTDGFGSIEFDGTIFEYNLINGYFYGSPSIYSPIKFKGGWNEGSGQLSGGAATVSLDQWSGTTLSTTAFTKHGWIFDGAAGLYVFEGGFFTDAHIVGTNIDVEVVRARVENDSGFGGAPSIIDNPDSCHISVKDPYTVGQFQRGKSVTSSGVMRYENNGNAIDSSVVSAFGRWATIAPMASKETWGYTSVVSQTFDNTPINTGNGSFSLVGSVVSDSNIFAECNEYTRAAFASSEYTQVLGTAIVTTAGWYLFTVDFKVTQGDPKVFVWDRNTAQFASSMAAPTQDEWYTFAAIGYSAGSQDLYLDFGGSDEDCTWRVSAYQLHRFNTRAEAQNYLNGRSYAV